MCMTLFCLIIVWHGFLSCRKKIFTEASATFQDAISKEMNTRLGSIPIKPIEGHYYYRTLFPMKKKKDGVTRTICL